MKPGQLLQPPHCAQQMGSLFLLTTSSGGPRADHGRKQVAGGGMETGDCLGAAHYGSNWTPLLAGLSPAGMAASLAAPDPSGPNSGTRLPPWVSDGETCRTRSSPCDTLARS